MAEARSDWRESRQIEYSVTWQGRDGAAHAIEARGVDVSASGIGITCHAELKTGAIVFLHAHDGSFEGDCEVIHCTHRGGIFHVGLEVREERQQNEQEEKPKTPVQPIHSDREPDHYEALQISRKADTQTIHRVFRMMAARFHPDNPETGDVDQFLRMKRAYAVLSDPEQRAEYDAGLDKEAGPRAIFGLKDFVTGVEAEANRRLGVLSLLYLQRQTNPDHPEVSLLDLEKEMGFPREYLSFTMWYLRAKDLVCAADNSDYVLTAAGADFVEKKAMRSDIVGQLLNPGSRAQARAERSRRRSPVEKKGPIMLPEPRVAP
jgi:curved DNA-binding protein CbpA